ncbi:potassium transporter [Trematosphaeria pertusa]|uniref:Potassium transport protein n=1 Tax=Trematosphaeria pertusa TaxID=390896 RepID=A0A6A6IBI7_9PLEO|nr:potassium transporter [Trematosphaeria pertusa]KAF2247945.1 potassium transporter [Trematosphaeria pertusa]
MWTPPLNFISLHYAYILSLGLLGLIIMYPYGNLRAVDAYFFGVSASTESGLNTVDVKDLETYQQLFIYFIPIIANLGFINIIVVVVRLHWFERRLKPPTLLRGDPNRGENSDREKDPEAVTHEAHDKNPTSVYAAGLGSANTTQSIDQTSDSVGDQNRTTASVDNAAQVAADTKGNNEVAPSHVAFALERHPRHESKSLYVPSPREREQGHPVVELDEVRSDDGTPISSTWIMLGLISVLYSEDEIVKATNAEVEHGGAVRRRKPDGLSIVEATSIERVASSVFVLGATPSHERPRSQSRSSQQRHPDMPYLSSQATIGRNSQFTNLTAHDREKLGGIEYRSLKLLLKIVLAYFFGLHLFGAICLVGWIQNANPKYLDYLKECGQDKNWWAFYSAQTMVDNLGFTLTPDSMITFQDATFPMLVMSFLAYAGNTCYPCLLRFVIWAMSKLVPKNSSLKEPLDFLLKHPRRCYTLLFPSHPTWILFGILFALNFVDVLLIVVLDLHNPAVNNLPGGPRVLAAIFQAASSRHTGTSTFNLADVNPAVQFSLLVMMYISVYPIAIAVRASNTYEEKALGVYLPDVDYDENKGTSYVLRHMQNQLSFDLWYIFLGIFCICVAEADKIVDNSNPAVAVFPIFFEVVSAYGNVGLSLGHPSVLTSLCGQFTPFSKIVICAMMIRGRHRGLPYQLDRAIMLPGDRTSEDGESEGRARADVDADGGDMRGIKRYHTR